MHPNFLFFKLFPISRDPPEGGTAIGARKIAKIGRFPISRDPPEGGTLGGTGSIGVWGWAGFQFLGIPPKGEPEPVPWTVHQGGVAGGFQFLGIPPKGEQGSRLSGSLVAGSFQFLGIPPKGEHRSRSTTSIWWPGCSLFPISRDPPEGGTCSTGFQAKPSLNRFQFLGIPPKGEHM